jgi:hypothetical protein
MNNFVIAIKRFISNKNTVTIIGVFLGVLVLYLGYNYRIQQAIRPVRMPYATETIQPRTKINEDMIGFIDVPPVRLKGNIIKNASEIINKYVNVNTVIPEGSLFYKDTIVNFNELPDAALIDIPVGMIPYNFKVDIESTYGNSIFPNNKIDIYFKGINTKGDIMVGKFIENIKVLAVKDRQGRHVFENTEEARTPSTLIFAVPEEIHILLRSASYMKDQEVELIPVPHGGQYVVDGDTTEVTNTVIESFIREYAPDISEYELNEDNPEQE